MIWGTEIPTNIDTLDELEKILQNKREKLLYRNRKPQLAMFDLYFNTDTLKVSL